MRSRAQALVLFGFGAVTLMSCKSEPESPLAQLAAKSTADEEMSKAIPIFSVANLRRSQAYYRDVLGFCVEWDYGNPPTFGSVGRGDARFFLCEKCTGKNAWTMVFVKNVDQLYSEISRKGATIRRPPTNEPWHTREMQVVDLDGNVIRFGSHQR